MSAITRTTTAVVAAACLALLAGCSNHGTGSHVAQLGASAASNAATGSPAPSAHGNGALAFAQCMRAHGFPGWPDPDSTGHFDKATLRRLNYNSSQVIAVEDGACNHLLPSAPASDNPTITPQEQQDYLDAAACMRSHGITNFPDPTFPGGRINLAIPPSIDTNSTQFTQAAQVCTKLIPTALPYSSPRA